MIKNLIMSSILALSLNSIYYVYTPHGSGVLVEALGELTPLDIARYNSETDSNFPLATRIASSTRHYNCHSYAWYSQNINTNIYWMKNPSLYIADSSYHEISYNQVQPRDRICYFDENNYIEHSGIVLCLTGEVQNNVCGYSNTVMVQSKWGNQGLIQHKGDYCPYVSTYNGEASYVKFYRLNEAHTHAFSYTCMNDIYHYEICSCGTLLFQHNFELNIVHPNINNPSYIPEYVCMDCGFTTLNPSV